MNPKDLTPDQLSDLRELFVDRYIDNMDTQDLVEYVFNDMTRYVDTISDQEFLDECENYWEDVLPEIIQEIKELD